MSELILSQIILMKFISFSREKPDQIFFQLRFRGQQDQSLQDFIFGLLIEIAPRTTVNGQIAILVGPLALFQESLFIEQQTVSIATTPSTFPVRTTRARVTTPTPSTSSKSEISFGFNFIS